MFKVKLAYNDKHEELYNQLKESIPTEAFNEDVYKTKRKAFMLKGSFGARQVPFCALYYKGNPIKAFYTENKTCTYENVEKAVLDYVEEHALKGYMTITQIEGSQEGRFEKGMTERFMEGISLYLQTNDAWYRTSTVESINWNDCTFKTKNSTYKFTLITDEGKRYE